MANELPVRINRHGKDAKYIKYKLSPSDANKGLRQIAREQLGNENLFIDIIRWLDAPNAQGFPWEEIQNKDSIPATWTLGLPVVEAITATFTIKNQENIRRSPKVEAGNIHFTGQPGTVYTYKKNSLITDLNGLVWVDVTDSNIPGKVSGATYWMCVREGGIYHTEPKI